LLQKGWADNVRLTTCAGRIRSVTAEASPQAADFVAGIVIPGMCNAHSHSFQRALAGRTEQRSPAGQDNFWTWRERMYALAARLDAESFAAIALQAYCEMLESGYTSVAEFHYLHRQPGGAEQDEAIYEALRDAATTSGIRLVYVPVLYERAGFDQPQADGQQKLFALDLDSFLAHHVRASQGATDRMHVGIGAHSLRAVSAASLTEIARAADNANIPMHLHIAEQRREVDQCLAATGRRPVDWLLENFDLHDRWCLVHATHMDASETRRLADTGAVVCLCPSTEANLGDGLFPLRDYLSAGGQIAIGSDSHITINPFEELRWLEYGQRLATQSRNVAAVQEAHVGHALFSRALIGGALASGQAPDGLQPGAPADLVTLHDDDPMLLAHGDASILDALLFCGYRVPIDRVMVHGDWRVVDGNHVAREQSRAAYAATLDRIGAAQWA
ncbi:MAG: formimidoylglutamate deiminase, partial [Gammaproteobacteria bacterium]|nr:formimidoylglutamate deiminase [Gammaproteobacteria bacterium]